MSNFSTTLRSVAITAIPVVLIALLTIYIATHRTVTVPLPDELPGKPLAANFDLYPVRSTAEGHLYLDKAVFMKAVRQFLADPSPKAISDLIYLGQSNNISLSLTDPEKQEYSRLLADPRYGRMLEEDKQRDRIFEIYRDIVNGIGQTFAGTGMEIVLHDTRNPLKSVVAIQNPISGRRIGDTTTNFGLELIKNYSIIGQRSSSFLSYELTLKDGRKIKSSTIPLYNEYYGLVGFICLNIDTSKLNDNHPEAIAAFLANFKAIEPSDKINELIDNARQQTAPAKS